MGIYIDGLKEAGIANYVTELKFTYEGYIEYVI